MQCTRGRHETSCALALTLVHASLSPRECKALPPTARFEILSILHAYAHVTAKKCRYFQTRMSMMILIIISIEIGATILARCPGPVLLYLELHGSCIPLSVFLTHIYILFISALLIYASNLFDNIMNYGKTVIPCDPRKKTSLGESLAGRHAYNPIGDSRRDSLARKISPTVSFFYAGIHFYCIIFVVYMIVSF